MDLLAGWPSCLEKSAGARSRLWGEKGRDGEMGWDGDGGGGQYRFSKRVRLENECFIEKKKKDFWKITLSKRSPPCFFVPVSNQPSLARQHRYTYTHSSLRISSANQSDQPTPTPASPSPFQPAERFSHHTAAQLCRSSFAALKGRHKERQRACFHAGPRRSCRC